MDRLREAILAKVSGSGPELRGWKMARGAGSAAGDLRNLAVWLFGCLGRIPLPAAPVVREAVLSSLRLGTWEAAGAGQPGGAGRGRRGSVALVMTH